MYLSLHTTNFINAITVFSHHTLLTKAATTIVIAMLVLLLLVLGYEDKALEKPLKLVLKVGGSEVTELSGSGHDSSYYDDRSDHERERHKEKKKKKKKKSEKDKDKYVDDEDRRRRKVSLQVSKHCEHSLFNSLPKNVFLTLLGREEKEKRTRTERIRSSSHNICLWFACGTFHFVQNY